MSRKALGRGLEALIPTRPSVETANGVTNAEAARRAPAARVAAEATDETMLEIRVDVIQANPYQPRSHFDPVKLDELARSVKKNGLLQPLVVRQKNGVFELIAGERRLRAARIAGLEQVPVHVRNCDDEELLRLAILENVQREDLNPIEEARGYRRLIDEFGMQQQDVAEQLAKSRSAIANTLRLLNLPDDLQARIESGELTSGHARALLSAESLEEQMEIANLVREKGLTVRDVEHLARPAGPKASRKRAKADRAGDPHLLELAKRLEARLGTRVRIKSKAADGSAGRIEIDYYSAADLERVFEAADVPYLL